MTVTGSRGAARRRAWLRPVLRQGSPLSPGVVAAIRRMASHPAWSGKGPLAELIATLGGPVLNPGEAWSDAALADAAERGQAWQALLSHAVTAESAKPSARWEKTARGLLAAVGERAAAERISGWLALVGRPRTIPLIGRGRGAEKLFDSYNVAGMRGLAWMLGFAAADAESARTLAALAQAALLRLPGLGPRAPRSPTPRCTPCPGCPARLPWRNWAGWQPRSPTGARSPSWVRRWRLAPLSRACRARCSRSWPCRASG